MPQHFQPHRRSLPPSPPPSRVALAASSVFCSALLIYALASLAFLFLGALFLH